MSSNLIPSALVMVTYQEAVLLAEKIKKLSPAVLSVELFGSVLRNGQGRDADFMVLVSDELARKWWRRQGDSIKTKWPDALYKYLWIVKKFVPFIYEAMTSGRRKEKLKVSMDLLGINLGGLADARGEIPDFEMFLVPNNWRAGRELNLDLMKEISDSINDKNTLGFFRRIADQASKVA